MNSNCDLKICDFGLARANLPDLKILNNVMTDYVATRWYRAPELLLAWKEYSYSGNDNTINIKLFQTINPKINIVDVWSVGCLFAELLRRKPFLPGTDTRNQIELIIDFLGTPSEAEINNIPREKSRKLIRSFPRKKGRSFETYFKNATPLGNNLFFFYCEKNV